ncbi:MAG: hypothetical protein ACREBP_10630, partial [Sphingomicrobium sp.]
EALIDAAVRGCQQAGLTIESVGAGREVLPAAICPAGTEPSVIATPRGPELLEVSNGLAWRSRRADDSEQPTNWHATLAGLDGRAAEFAMAFAATVGRPRLSLLSPAACARRAGEFHARARRLFAVAAALWLLAAGIADLRLRFAISGARAELEQLAPVLDSIETVERDLLTVSSGLNRIEAGRQNRSRHLELLARLTTTLGDSVSLASLRVDSDRALHLAGLAPVADAVVATLERMPGVRRARLEAPVSRQRINAPGGRELDRFAIAVEWRVP